MQAVRPEHILPATQTKCCGGALSDHACPAVDGLPAIEKTRHKDAIDPALQNCGYAEPEERERENDEIGCLDLGDLLLDVFCQGDGLHMVPLLQRVGGVTLVLSGPETKQ